MVEDTFYMNTHGQQATSWKEESVTDIMRREGVIKVRSDVCKFGMFQESGKGVDLVKKPTGFMTNPAEIAEELKGKCAGGHTYIHLLDGRAKRAEVYADELCYKILTGHEKRWKNTRRLHRDHGTGR